MRKTMMVGILMSALSASSPGWAQTNTEDIALLAHRVEQLEKQVQELSRLLEPIKAQQAMEQRRNALHQKFEQRAAQDREKYSSQQLGEAEELYQVASKKWGSPEATGSLQAMIKKYPDVNRTGCAVLYLAQSSKGDERAKYLQDCIEKYQDCFYGDGVQVGAYARFLLAQDYQGNLEFKRAEALDNELKTKYADAIDHSGHLLLDSLKPEKN